MNYSIPLYRDFIQAGFPSPIDESIEQYLDLNEFLIKSKSSTFFIRVEGRSMVEAGIFPRDILIVDRSLKAKDQDVILAVVDGKFTVKRLVKNKGQIILKAESPNHQSLCIQSHQDFEVWGVVTSVIHRP